MNYAAIKPVDVANGPGIRVSLFVSGCTHRCKGCFNKKTWDFSYGSPFDGQARRQVLKFLDHSYVAGLSLLGGEPLEPDNQEELLLLLRKVHKRFPDKTVWCYSGYTMEYILEQMLPASAVTRELLTYVDVLVDGPYIEKEKDLNLRFRGSRNQRILDLPESLRAGKAVWCGGVTGNK